MKFAHLADTHLGKRSLKLAEREKDFESAFKQAIDIIIKENVDFVIHSGDLFDTGKPDVNSMIFCAKQLYRLKDKGIPMYIIPGSHDQGYGETKSILSLFEEAGLLINVGDKRYIKDNKLYGEMYNDVFICGIGGWKSRISELYKSIEPVIPKEAKYKIFMLHQTVSAVSNVFADIDTELLPKGFDYYAAGHWHGREIMKYHGKPLIYPGSLENCDATEMERNEQKGIFIVKDGNPQFVPIKSRKVIVKKFEFNGESPDEITQKCIDFISNKVDEKPILILRLTGSINGKRSEIDKALINKTAIENGYLYANILLSGLREPEEEKISIESENVDQIEKEYLKSKGYTNEQIELAKKLMSVLGQELTPSEIERLSLKMYKMIENEIEKDKA